MKKLLVLLLAMTMTVSLVGCNEGNAPSTSNTEAQVSMIDEAAAKEVAFADAGIAETAAENLTVKFENNTYIIAFDWSGFDYQYTVDGATGEIVEEIFDGEVM